MNETLVCEGGMTGVRVRMALIQSVPNNWIDTRVKGSVALEIGLNSQVQWYSGSGG